MLTQSGPNSRTRSTHLFLEKYKYGNNGWSACNTLTGVRESVSACVWGKGDSKADEIDT